jgi:protein SCO1/2
MKTFRIILWSTIAILVAIVGYLSFNWQVDQGANETAFGGSFTLTDQNGNAITEAAFQDKPTALFFGFTHCPEICPTTLYELDAWMEEADPTGENINGYFVSVDPEKDTAEILKLYVGNVTDRITGITGEPDDVHQMLKKFKIYFKKTPLDAAEPEGDYTMDHTASVLLLNNQGRFKSTIAYGENSDTAVQKLKNLIKG